jgi:hypothetical protein
MRSIMRAAPQLALHGRVLEVQLRQIQEAGPRSSAGGVLGSDGKPLAPWALRVRKGVLKTRRVAAHVVEHAIQHELHAGGVHGAGQAAKVVVCAVLRRDLAVVQRVVLVIRVGQMDRVQVENVRAERPHVGHLRRGAAQVTAPEVEFRAVELLVFEVLAGTRHVGPRMQHLRGRVQRALALQIFSGHEAVDDDLIDDGAVASVPLSQVERAGPGFDGGPGPGTAGGDHQAQCPDLQRDSDSHGVILQGQWANRSSRTTNGAQSEAGRSAAAFIAASPPAATR